MAGGLCWVGACPRPVEDQAYVCTTCGAAAHESLTRVAEGDLVEQLDTALARQARIGSGGGRRGAEVPLAFGEAASEAAAVLRATMSSWVRVLLDDVYPIGPVCGRCAHVSCRVIGSRQAPADTLRAMADWLARRVEVLRYMRAGAEAVDELVAAVAQAEQATDRPADRRYLGICSTLGPDGECGTHLYSYAEAPLVQCRDCGAVHNVLRRRDILLGAAEDVLGTATELARAVTGLGRDVTPERIRQWAHRGRLAAAGQTTEHGRTHPLYRLGDILDLLGREAAACAT